MKNDKATETAGTSSGNSPPQIKNTNKKTSVQISGTGVFSGGLRNEALIDGIFPVFDEYSWNIPNKFTKKRSMFIVFIDFIPLKFNPPCIFLHTVLKISQSVTSPGLQAILKAIPFVSGSGYVVA